MKIIHSAVLAIVTVGSVEAARKLRGRNNQKSLCPDCPPSPGVQDLSKMNHFSEEYLQAKLASRVDKYPPVVSDKPQVQYLSKMNHFSEEYLQAKLAGRVDKYPPVESDKPQVEDKLDHFSEEYLQIKLGHDLDNPDARPESASFQEDELIKLNSELAEFEKELSKYEEKFGENVEGIFD